MTTYQPNNKTDELNLLEFVYVLVKYRYWVVVITALGFILGYVNAVMKGPTYIAEAVIAAKDNDSQHSPNLSGLGAFSGIVANQLNISVNPGLDKIEQILNSRRFGAELVEKNNLLPFIYSYEFPKIYQNYYDSTLRDWREGFVPPNLLNIGGLLKDKYLRIIIKNGVMRVYIESSDSIFTDTLISKYIAFLNLYIKEAVQNDANDNVFYLQKQLYAISDPLLREKIQGMIAGELEKAMLVSKEAFRVIDPPIRSKQFREKKLFPTLYGTGTFMVTAVLLFLFYAFTSSRKTEADRNIILEIKKEMGLKRK